MWYCLQLDYLFNTFKLKKKTSTGHWFNIKMPSYQYRKSHCGDKTILRPSYLHNGISYTGKMASLYWIGALVNMDSPHKGPVMWKAFPCHDIFMITEMSPMAFPRHDIVLTLYWPMTTLSSLHAYLMQIALSTEQKMTDGKYGGKYPGNGGMSQGHSLVQWYFYH